MGKVNLDFIANDDGVRKLLQQFQMDNDKLHDKIKALQQTNKTAAQQEREWRRMQLQQIRKVETEQQALAASAKKIIDATRTPFEKYKVEAGKLREHLQAGRIDTDTYRRALAALAKETKQLSGDTARENEELREAAQILKRTESATERYQQAVARLNHLRRSGKIDSTTYGRAIKQERDALDSATPKAAGFGQRMAEVAGGVLSANLAMAAGRKAVELLKQEYDRLIERQERSLGANTSLAKAQEKAADNLGEDPNLNLQQLFERLRQESLRTGTNEADLTNAVTDALSARGDQSAEAAIQSVLAAGKLRRFSPEDLPTLSGASLDIGKATGLSAEQSLGFLSTIGQLSRVTSLQKLGQNVSPAVTGIQNFGASKEFGGAIIAAISQGSQDFMGATSGTGGIALAEQLRSFGAGAPIEETFRDILSSPEYRDAFLASASFEKKVLPAIEQLLTEGTSTNNQFANALQVLQNTNFQQRFDERVSQVDALPAAQIARAEMAGQNFVNQMAASDEGGALSAVVRKTLAEARTQLGEGALSVQARGMLDDLAAGGRQSLPDLITALEADREKLNAPAGESRTAFALRALGGTGQFLGPAFDKYTGFSKTDAATVQKQTAAFDEMVVLLRQIASQQQQLQNKQAAAGRKNNQGEGQ